MDRRITRRDFLDGAAIGAGAALAAPLLGTHRAATSRGASYPPSLEGLRGSTSAAMRIPHELRDGTFWKHAPPSRPLDESYDLVVVGGGISGLTAAYAWRRARGDAARILVLENHDDIGGHARRNEFRAGGGRGRLLITNGGSESFDTPSSYSAQAKRLLRELGIDVERFYRYYDRGFYGRFGLGDSVFLNRERFGRDHLAVEGKRGTRAMLAGAPLVPEAKRDLVELLEAPRDWLAGMSDARKKQRLSELTYARYLLDVAHMHPQVVTYLQTLTSNDWGYGIDGVGAIDAWADGNPGFDGLRLDDTRPYHLNAPTEKKTWYRDDPYIFHFPDGNAGLVRALVRRLIPEAVPGHTMESLVLAPESYALLDRPGAAVRIRLSSPVVRVSRPGAGGSKVEVSYVQDGRLRTVKASHCILACWNTMIPYICPELPASQREALAFAVKIPLLYGKVQLANWHPFVRGKVQYIRFASMYWIDAFLDYPVSMGGYRHPSAPDEPIVLHMTATPCKAGMPPREGSRVGRADLYATAFHDLERRLRDQLARSLGPFGFDPATDIQGLTINRWSHGYAFEYGRPWDTFYPDGPLPHLAARRRFGPISIANSDAGARAYADEAIDQGLRAATEQLSRT